EAIDSLKGRTVTEKRHDDIGFQSGEPLIRRFKMTFALRIGGKLGFKRLCAGKSPGGIPAGMGTESRSIPAVTHIADKQGAIWVAQMHFGFKIPVIHHPGSEISADQ